MKKKFFLISILIIMSNYIFADVRTDAEFLIHTENLMSLVSERLDYDAESFKRHNIGLEGRFGIYELNDFSFFSNALFHEFWDSKNNVSGTYSSIGLGMNYTFGSEKQLNGVYLITYPMYDFCLFNNPKNYKPYYDWNLALETG